MTEDTIQEHRKARLRELIDTFFRGRIVDFAECVGKDSTYIGRMLYPLSKKQSRPVSEKMVRTIVDQTNVPPDWFDQPSIGTASQKTTCGAIKVESLTASTTKAPEQAGEDLYASVAWPFRMVSYQRLMKLLEQLGKRRGLDAMRDIDAYLDVLVTKWENDARSGLRHHTT